MSKGTQYARAFYVACRRCPDSRCIVIGTPTSPDEWVANALNDSIVSIPVLNNPSRMAL